MTEQNLNSSGGIDTRTPEQKIYDAMTKGGVLKVRPGEVDSWCDLVPLDQEGNLFGGVASTDISLEENSNNINLE